MPIASAWRTLMLSNGALVMLKEMYSELMYGGDAHLVPELGFHRLELVARNLVGDVEFIGPCSA
jgi:hypothetical protein